MGGIQRGRGQSDHTCRINTHHRRLQRLPVPLGPETGTGPDPNALQLALVHVGFDNPARRVNQHPQLIARTHPGSGPHGRVRIHPQAVELGHHLQAAGFFADRMRFCELLP